jgi:hypothetical protein
MVLTAATARNTYHIAYNKPLSQGLLQSYRRRQRSPSPSRPSSRRLNCLSCSESVRSNASPSPEIHAQIPRAASYTPNQALAAR